MIYEKFRYPTIPSFIYINSFVLFSGHKITLYYITEVSFCRSLFSRKRIKGAQSDIIPDWALDMVAFAAYPLNGAYRRVDDLLILGRENATETG